MKLVKKTPKSETKLLHLEQDSKTSRLKHLIFISYSYAAYILYLENVVSLIFFSSKFGTKVSSAQGGVSHYLLRGLHATAFFPRYSGLALELVTISYLCLCLITEYSSPTL